MARSLTDLPQGTAKTGALESELPNLRHLRLLVVAVEKGSLTLAAESVHISQPAASQAMARLGSIFGAKLLERVGNSVAATPEGQIVVGRARRALDHLHDVNRRLAQRGRGAGAGGGGALERYATMPQLRAIGTYADAGSFSAAARHLGQTEPSVQRACRDIERMIGVPLFEGNHRNLHLTAAGHILSAQASLVLKEIAETHAELRERAGMFDGRLVIGTLPLVRTRIVPDAVVALMSRYPAARIEIIDGSYESLVQRLRYGTCDLLVGALREGSLGPGLEEQVLFHDTLSVVARAGHPLAGRRLLGSELARFPWVLPRRQTPSRQTFEHLVAEWGVADLARGYVETGSLVALRGIVLASDSIALISARQVDYEMAQGLMVLLDFAIPQGERPIGVTTLANWRPTAVQTAFVACLAGQFETSH